jgi:hypothetical protein
MLSRSHSIFTDMHQPRGLLNLSSEASLDERPLTTSPPQRHRTPASAASEHERKSLAHVRICICSARAPRVHTFSMAALVERASLALVHMQLMGLAILTDTESYIGQA